MSNNIVVTYRNLHPTNETREFITSIINEIYNELPATSTIKATFSAKDDVVKGMMHVNSHGGPFFAVAISTSVNEIGSKLLEQMRRRIDKFKTKTYRRLSIKKLPFGQEFAENTEELEAELVY